MASPLKPVRGTHDILSPESRIYRHIVDTAYRIAEYYGFDEISTPIFEFTEVFKRTLGDVSDIVQKEMYTFTDRGGDEVTLRPEGTAAVARAVISGGMTQALPLKFFYAGPMFRYERPQKGRLRQFHQFGVETLGQASPYADVEAIALAVRILDGLGLREQTVLEINSLGDQESRAAYRTALVDFLTAKKAALSKESQERLERNPLRVLDSKSEEDRALLGGAPLLPDYLNDTSRDFMKAVLEGLDALGIAYKMNPHLVRGLDYYCDTAFEFTTTALGAQGTVLAGGRYNDLVRVMGGPDVPGIGWAAGIERLAMLVESVPGARRPIAVIPATEAGEKEALRLTEELRAAGLPAEFCYRGNLSKRLKYASRLEARAALLLGDDEMAAGEVTLRDLDSGEQGRVSRGAVFTALRDLG